MKYQAKLKPEQSQKQKQMNPGVDGHGYIGRMKSHFHLAGGHPYY